MAALRDFKADPPGYDPVEAAELLATYQPRFDVIPADRVEIPRLDADAVARTVLSAYSLTQAAPLLALYKAAASVDLFALATLDHLKSLGLVFLHCYRRADAAGAFRSGTKIPAELDKQSAAVEARLQKVLEHNFLDHPVVGPQLRLLSPGISYLDRAFDLLSYADLYEEQHAVVSKDTQYRATDVADARSLGAEILKALGAHMTPEGRAAYDLLRRTWTLLKPVYFEVQQLGLGFLRHDPQRNERFPSLYTAGRAAPAKKKKADGGSGKPGEDTKEGGNGE